MPVGVLPSNSRSQRLGIVGAAIALVLAIAISSATAQGSNPLARRWADARVQAEEVEFLRQTERITPDAARVRTAAIHAEIATIRSLISPLLRETQAAITREANSLFEVRIVPLREEWRQAGRQKQQDDQARNVARRTELVADA